MAQNELRALQQQVGLFQHDAVIAGEVGFALGAIDDKGIDGCALQAGQLDAGGESRAAQSHQTAGAHRHQNILQLRADGGRSEGLIDGLLAIGGDDNGFRFGAAGIEDLLDGLDLTRYAGMDRCRNRRFTIADELADLNGIANLYDRLAGGADVLRHGNGDLGRDRHDHAFQLGCVLLVLHMDAGKRMEHSHRYPS